MAAQMTKLLESDKPEKMLLFHRFGLLVVDVNEVPELLGEYALAVAQ